jgi:hypothetical protein
MADLAAEEAPGSRCDARNIVSVEISRSGGDAFGAGNVVTGQCPFVHSGAPAAAKL